MKEFDNPQLQLAREFVWNTNTNVFLTGRAGTGKTTFLHTLRKESPKRMIVVAPTGVAAVNAGGVTLHSFFQLPFGPIIPGQLERNFSEKEGKQNFRRFSREKIAIMRTLDLLVIDEVSMVRADLLDGVDEVLRRFRANSAPFGGIQLLLIGDMHQLPPVIRKEEWELLKQFYDSPYFFESRALSKTFWVPVELQHVYRQSDEEFIRILNEVRNQNLSAQSVEMLNKRYRPGSTGEDADGYIVLTTHNSPAQAINEKRLHQLPGKLHTFRAAIEGEFPEQMYPTGALLEIKKGAQVMFLKNDPSPEKQYFNGKIGVVTELDGEEILVQCPGEDEIIPVKPTVWENVSYSIDAETKEIKEKILGTFVQYPLKLAWAVTIHKSQGLTFDRVIIDARAAFAHGQVYVALSRCRSLEGIVLSSELPVNGIRADSSLLTFVSEISKKQPDRKLLAAAQKEYSMQLMKELFDFTEIGKNLTQLVLLVKKNKNILVQPQPQSFFFLENHFRTEIADVAEKFQVQLVQLFGSPEGLENQLLQERVKKACSYFEEKLMKQLYEPLEEMATETDNRMIRNQVEEVRKHFLALTRQKILCLQSCSMGFSVKEYLKTKSKALLEEEIPEPRPTKRKKEQEDTGAPVHETLYNRIKSWRNRKALEADLSVYQVLQLRTIQEIARVLPCTLPDLKKIRGIGKRKAETYGEEILEMVKEYCRESGLEISETTVEEKKQEKVSTRHKTFFMWQEGKNLEEIAQARNLTVQTVEEHLAYFVGIGELDIYSLVPSEKVRIISEAFSRQDSFRLAPVKEKLGETVSWAELRFVARHLEFIKRSGK